MTGVSESRRLRLLSVALGTLVVIAFAVTSKAGARAFPEAGPSQTFAAAGTSAAAPQVSLTVAGAVGKAEPISASATALAPLASIGIGYCPGWTCSAAFASEISSAPGGVLKTLWTGLPPDGTYTLVAYAVTADGVGGESTPVTVTVDSTPPDTSIVSAPSSTDPVDTATFQLASNEPGATFQCKIDTTSIWTDCSSPVVVFGVAAGSHQLTVRAVDAAGNVDPTPATATWKANAPSAPPETTITNGPDALVNTRNQTIQFTSNNPLATFECAVDSVTFVACLSPRPVLNRPDGPHVFRVRAVVGGVADPTPAEVSWTIDATAPTVTISPSRVADGKGFYGHSVTFTTSGTDAGGTVTCSAPQTYNGPDVSHLAIVGSCTDAAGNTKSATFDLRYDTTAPAVRVAFRVRDRNGWYNRAFNITWLGTDNTGGSGGVTCTPVQHYAGPDTASGSLSGSCSDAVGNTASGTFPFAYDDTDPTLSATPSRTPDSGDWYNAPLSVSFSGSDALSGGVTCDPAVDYSGPDTGTASLTGTCMDAAGNIAPTSFSLAYDSTPPVVSASAGRAADHNGWYNAPVAITFSGDDAISGGVSCDPTRVYSGPDRASASVIGSCSDAAGNFASASLGLAYDATGPTVSIGGDRPADHNGWYSHTVSFATTGVDSTSGIASCSVPQPYSAPDTAAGSASGSCIDVAGNTSSKSTPFKYDATAPTATAVPTATPNAAGWLNAPFSVGFTGTDATSGPVACSPSADFSGPDSPLASVSGSCTDQAGNATGASFFFKYDATAPSVTALPARAADQNGWYNHPVTVSFSGTDVTSKGVTCDATRTLSTDGAAALVAGTCTDAAGNVGSGSVGLSYDSHAPAVSATPARDPNAAGWFRAPVAISFSGIDALSGVASCSPATTYSGPDTAATTVSGTCTDTAGNSATSGYSVQYDATAPAVSVTAQRPPDTAGAYTSPITFDVSGTDATSEGVACDGPATYSGPDSSNATVNGTCTDAAGNQGTGSATFGYQTTTLDTNLLQTPATLTNHTSDQFTFSATKTPATFTCVLDGTSAACTSPFTVSSLTDGQHAFSVAAKDGAGNTDATPATFTWTVDTVAPDTALDTTGFPDPSTGPVSFPFTSEPSATFECSLDGTTFSACISPKSLGAPADGSHTFRVRALDAAGNVDASPASVTWTQDNTAPVLTLTGTPPAISSSSSATFSWTSNESATASCKIDTATFATCGTGTTGSKTFLNLLPGSHTFSLRGRDAAGNLSTTTTFTWTFNSGPPDTTIDPASQPTNPTASTSALFTFTSTKPPSTFQCKLDGAVSFTGCSSPQAYSGLASGTHTFSVAAIDSLNNVDPTPATFTWLVDATNPTGSISAPTEAATVSGTTAVTATANDNVSVLTVQFKLDGADLGTPVTSAPFSTNWDTTNSSDGPHTLTAVVTDEVGNRTTTAAVHVTVSNGAAHPAATATPDLVDVGPGSVDATTRNVMRTSAGRVYIVANDDHGLTIANRTANGGAGVIHMYEGNQAGTPTAFSEVDAVNHPVSGGRTANTSAFGGVDVRLGGDGIAQMVFNDNASSFELDYKTFSTATDTWAPAETIDTAVGQQDRGRIKFALALDASNVPHVLYAKGSALLYRNRAGGTWSAPVTVEASGAPLHPMLAFDSSGVLHATWLEDTGAGSSLRYATRTGTTWSTPEVIPTGAILTNGNADQGPSIATDSAGRPYVLYVGPSLGTFGPVGHTALYGAIKIMEKLNGTWTDVSPTADMRTHTPQVYVRGNDLYAFSGHDTDINFSYNRRLAGGSWGTETKLTKLVADGSASVRWDPLHETDSSIIDAATFNEDRLGNGSFLGEVYYSAVLPTAADPTPPSASLTAPAANATVSGSTVSLSATAADNVGVAGVTFKVDGAAVAAEDTTSPYGLNWDSTTVANGAHTLTAVARDAAGNTTASTGVTVTVSNAGAPPPAALGVTLFGSSTAASNADTNAPGQIEAFDVGTVTAGSITRMHVFLDAPLPSSVLVGLYTNNAGKPGTLMSSTSVTGPVAGWNDVGFGPVALTTGQHYWVALLTPSGAAVGPHFRDAKTGGAGLWIGSLGLSALPGAWPAGGTPNTDGPISAYATS